MNLLFKYIYNIITDLFNALPGNLVGPGIEPGTSGSVARNSSPNIIRMIKSMRMRWAGHVARMGETRNAYRILVGKPEGIKTKT
jgi:hypothetical protein